MDPRTRAQLRDLNRRFYERSGDAFASSRDHPWPGWDRIPLPVRSASDGAVRVLDVGCGNARFAKALARRMATGFVYTGIDESGVMLAHAKEGLAGLDGVRSELRRADVLADPQPGGLASDDAFDLVVAFGVLHHVPGLEARRSFMRTLAGCVAVGGVLVVTAWQFADRARFRDRVVPWSACAPHGAPLVETSELEPGDHLLGFGDDSAALRYCHHCDDAELDALAGATGLEPLARYSADGRGDDLNRYLVLRRGEAHRSG